MFRTVSWLHVRRIRASKGRKGGRIAGMPVLLVTAPGRKSGTPHTTPLVYLKNGDSWVVTGSAGGSATEPQWFRNLRATDRATVEVGEVRTNVSVRIADADQREELWQQLVAVAPYFAGYQKKCDRVIPMAVLTPQR
jgi:deazaflavin-dependent oxidoreductase (nitroreductase family)